MVVNLQEENKMLKSKLAELELVRTQHMRPMNFEIEQMQEDILMKKLKDNEKLKQVFQDMLGETAGKKILEILDKENKF